MVSNSSLNGIVLVNKPTGLTSNAVLQRVKRWFGARKAGHTGSLDPLATGMLPVCFGEATKFSQFLLDADKVYEVTGCLGVKTTTGDCEGEPITHQESFDIHPDMLNETLIKFQGEIQQIPSMFSALKHQGVPLYRLARRNIQVERKPRRVNIYSLQLLSYQSPWIRLRVQCSKGTYIRNLIEDIGDDLGVGAHVVQLHRVYTAGFEQDRMYSLAALETMALQNPEQGLLPMDRAVNHLPMISLDANEVKSIRQGKSLLKMKSQHTTEDYVRLYSMDSQWLGIGEWSLSDSCHDILHAKRLCQWQ